MHRGWLHGGAAGPAQQSFPCLVYPAQQQLGSRGLLHAWCLTNRRCPPPTPHARAQAVVAAGVCRIPRVACTRKGRAAQAGRWRRESVAGGGAAGPGGPLPRRAPMFVPASCTPSPPRAAQPFCCLGTGRAAALLPATQPCKPHPPTPTALTIHGIQRHNLPPAHVAGSPGGGIEKGLVDCPGDVLGGRLFWLAAVHQVVVVACKVRGSTGEGDPEGGGGARAAAACRVPTCCGCGSGGGGGSSGAAAAVHACAPSARRVFSRPNATHERTPHEQLGRLEL